MPRIIFHIDVNSAFLSWSSVNKLRQGDSMDLRTIPAIIGGSRTDRHGIVLAKSELAKKCGIHTGEPIAQALKKCPTLTIEPPDRELYSRCSGQMMEYLHTITPDIQQVSIDECYLDFTPIAHRYQSPLELASTIQCHIRETFGFTVNIGIAPNRLLAKMASDFEKPDKIHTLYENEIPYKMWPLPVSNLFMTGRSSVKRLRELGIFTIGDLAHTDPAFLAREFKSQGKRMWEYANGIDDTPVDSSEREVKGVGNSITLAEDATTAQESKVTLLRLAESVSKRLRAAHQIAQSVTVEIRYNDFTNVSHQTQLAAPTNTTDQIYQSACLLFDELWNGTPLRLLGIRTAKLLPEDTPVQLSLFDLMPASNSAPAADHSLPAQDAGYRAPLPRNSDKLHKMESALDAIRQKYGENAVVRGSLLPPSDKN